MFVSLVAQRCDQRSFPLLRNVASSVRFPCCAMLRATFVSLLHNVASNVRFFVAQRCEQCSFLCCTALRSTFVSFVAQCCEQCSFPLLHGVAWANRQTDTLRHGINERITDRLIGHTLNDKLINSQTHRHADKHTDSQTDRLTDRHTDGQTDIVSS